MRIRSITIRGFRGFNDSCTIEFHDDLTLISAPNSHGKTSISEALEFLLYGETSKVARAATNREEYRDSYRNRHFPATAPAIIEAALENSKGTQTLLRVELNADGSVQRYIDNTAVKEWPFSSQLGGAASPFVLQHALKDLLLVSPTERFQGFARLLGLDDVDVMQQALVNLCTKPEANIPHTAKQLLLIPQNLDQRGSAHKELLSVFRELKKGTIGVENAYQKLQKRAEALINKKCKASELLSNVILTRDALASKVYAGTTAIRSISAAEQVRIDALKQKLAAATVPTFVDEYVHLASHDINERLKNEATLLALGTQFLAEDESKCPLCGQTLTLGTRQHIEERHRQLGEELKDQGAGRDIRLSVKTRIVELRSTATACMQSIEHRSSDLLDAVAEANAEKVRDLFGKENEASWDIVRSASSTITSIRKDLSDSTRELNEATIACEQAIENRKENSDQVESLAIAVQRFLGNLGRCGSKLDELEPALVGPSRILRQAVDATAGTTELTLIVELLEKKAEITKALRIRDVLDGLKELKKHVEQSVGEIMDAAIGSDLTGSVVSWYSKIRTQGDPDVHFSGFAMDRTKAGDFRSRRVRVDATSYGVGLASAVSSLSESKLNALGLCMNIARIVKAPGPWEFIVLDDPIQSWDEEHEIQFIQVIRSLIDEGRQIILLSHRNNWIDQVALASRSLNGYRYAITGYTREGPHVSEVEWDSVDQRLREALAIANDPTSSKVRLQQGEEEIRLVASQLASQIARRTLKRDRSPHNMNASSVRTILTEAGCPATLIDRVIATFATTDDSHHAPKDYEPSAQRVRQYHGTMTELKKWAETPTITSVPARSAAKQGD